MARKESAEQKPAHSFNDIIGIILIGFAVLLLVALLSYHPRDVSANGIPTNSVVRNWIGIFGAWLGYYWLFCVGAAAYVAPVLLLLVGLGCFFDNFAYLRRRWPWALLLFVCCFGILDLYKPYLEGLRRSLNTEAGGILGVHLNGGLFGYFGTVGATIIYAMLYFISLLSLPILLYLF